MTPDAKLIKVLNSAAYYEGKTVDQQMLLFLYKNRIGRFFLYNFFIRPGFSKLYALYYNSKWSIPAIKPFIKTYDIDMELYQPQEFRSFNDFFIRSFIADKRNFALSAAAMPAFCEGFYQGWERISAYQPTKIKGQLYTPEQLFGDLTNAAPFIDGPLIIARLAPYHYHWFHYIDDGLIVNQYHIAGKLHSVDTIAIGWQPDILFTNKRNITIVETLNFGKIAYIEVGALTVGKIHQLHQKGEQVKRGQKKGYFSFGGSTVLIIGEKGAWAPCGELLAHTARGMECAALLGQEIAQKKK